MKAKFLGQGLKQKKNNATGECLLKTLKKNKFNSLNMYVAFMRVSGLKEILEQLIEFNNHGTIKIFIGIDLHGTSKEALELLLEYNINTYIVYSPNTVTYHPKIYLFENEQKCRLILGSSNLTKGGLYTNVESSLCIDLKLDNNNDLKLLSDVKNYYESLNNNTHKSCQILNEELLEKLLESKLVISEKAIRKNFALAKKHNKNTIKGLFKTIKYPKGNKNNSVSQVNEEIITEEIPTLNHELESMWMQTKKLTGGSSNILDLAMTGNFNNTEKIGPSEFFEVNNKAIQTNITIHFDGDIYINNTIKYAPDNGSWRLQLKGRTEGEEVKKFTQLTANGAFKDKIIRFFKITPNEYRAILLEETELPYLQSISDWAYSGKRQGTKIYGFIL